MEVSASYGIINIVASMAWVTLFSISLTAMTYGQTRRLGLAAATAHCLAAFVWISGAYRITHQAYPFNPGIMYLGILGLVSVVGLSIWEVLVLKRQYAKLHTAFRRETLKRFGAVFLLVNIILALAPQNIDHASSKPGLLVIIVLTVALLLAASRLTTNRARVKQKAD